MKKCVFQHFKLNTQNAQYEAKFAHNNELSFLQQNKYDASKAKLKTQNSEATTIYNVAVSQRHLPLCRRLCGFSTVRWQVL